MAFEFQKPYDIMVGCWTGMANTYSPKGEFLYAVPSRVSMYWKDEKTFHYRQDEEDSMESVMDARVKAAMSVIHLSFDLKVQGKYSTGRSKLMDVTGRETIPGVYLFNLKARDGSGQYYNNQYFTSPGERHIIGPYVDNKGEIQLVVHQVFTRVSYDVPKKLRRALKL